MWWTVGERGSRGRAVPAPVLCYDGCESESERNQLRQVNCEVNSLVCLYKLSCKFDRMYNCEFLLEPIVGPKKLKSRKPIHSQRIL